MTYHNDAPEPVASKPVPEEAVMAGFKHVHPRAQDIIGHGSDGKLPVLCDRDPVENWVDGRVACWATRRIPSCSTWPKAPAW